MHPQPFPSWYVLAADGASPLRLLTDAGRADPALSATSHALLAALAEAIHATACHLSEAELRHAEEYLALQRWRR